jgi:hypothetical protein
MEDLSLIPIEKLEAEIRKRKLTETCVGELQISDCGKKAIFGLVTVPWPDGKYKILIQCMEDLTTTDPESKPINESQR